MQPRLVTRMAFFLVLGALVEVASLVAKREEKRKAVSHVSCQRAEVRMRALRELGNLPERPPSKNKAPHVGLYGRSLLHRVGITKYGDDQVRKNYILDGSTSAVSKPICLVEVNIHVPAFFEIY